MNGVKSYTVVPGPLQLPVAPIIPPDPEFEAYGRMEWDLPAVMAYTPYQEVTAIVEAWNPSDVDRLYGLEYYFIDPHGVVAKQDYITFVANGLGFAVFVLHAGAPEPMVTEIPFKAPGGGYRFGLRLLELEMVNAEATIKYETSRLEVVLGSRDNGVSPYTPVITGLMAVAIVSAMATGISEGGTT